MTETTQTKKTRRKAIGALVGIGAVTATAAFAAGVTVITQGVVAAGQGSGVSCQTGTLTTTLGDPVYNDGFGFQITEVTVSGISSECNGEQMSVQVLGEGASAQGEATTVTIALEGEATSQVVTLAEPTYAALSDGVAVAIY